MSWERESLWSKSRMYFEKAFAEDREQDTFGLWCAMGLELLARSSLAKFSPTLLAEPDRDHKYLLHALGLGSAKIARRSIATNQVLILCKTLIPEFTDEYLTLASALTGRRNEELHSGAAAFSEYRTQQWIAGFYKCCKVLAESQDETLADLFGMAEADAADAILTEIEGKVFEHTKGVIAAHKKVFDSKDAAEREALAAKAETQGNILSHHKHHRVTCPACSCVATVEGDTYGQEQIEHQDDGDIVVRQSVIPTKFSCIACGLKLNGYGELSSAGVADHFTHRIHYSPEEYYELIDPNDDEVMRSYAEDHGYYFFSNE